MREGGLTAEQAVLIFEKEFETVTIGSFTAHCEATGELYVSIAASPTRGRKSEAWLASEWLRLAREYAHGKGKHLYWRRRTIKTEPRSNHKNSTHWLRSRLLVSEVAPPAADAGGPSNSTPPA